MVTFRAQFTAFAGCLEPHPTFTAVFEESAVGFLGGVWGEDEWCHLETSLKLSASAEKPHAQHSNCPPFPSYNQLKYLRSGSTPAFFIAIPTDVSDRLISVSEILSSSTLIAVLIFSIL